MNIQSPTRSGQESPFEVVTPPAATKKAHAAKATPKAAGEDGGENAAGGSFSATEVKLLIEMLSTLGESSNGIKFNWAAISEKLELPSAGATAKRAERLLKRFDLKMSDVTGSARPGRTPKTTDGDATPGSKRKAGQGANSLETPTRRRGGAKTGVKKEEGTQGGSVGAGNETFGIEVLLKAKKGVKKEADDADGDVFGV